jgi:beta-phosphoglucomutase
MSNPVFLRTLASEKATPAWIELLSREKEENFRDTIHGLVKVFPGVMTWLDWFCRHNIPQALASSAPPENITAILAEVSLGRYFNTLVSSAGLPGKPDPAIFLTAAQRLNVEPSACLVVEDSLPGLQAAHAAQMKVIAVLTTQSADQMGSADIVVPDLTYLRENQITGLFTGSLPKEQR